MDTIVHRMSTNYFLTTPTSGIEISATHIAKQTSVEEGRVEFSFHSILNDFNVTIWSWQELKTFLQSLPDDVNLMDEHYETIPPDTFIEMVEASPTMSSIKHETFRQLPGTNPPTSWVDDDGYLWHSYWFR